MKKATTRKGKPENLAAGVRVSPVEHPRYSWRLSYSTGEGESKRRHQRYYHSKADALEVGREKAHELTQVGKLHSEITDAERRAVLDFREMVDNLPHSVALPSLSDAVSCLKDTLRLRNKSQTVQLTIDDYLKGLQRKQVSPEYLTTIKARLERFIGDYGDWLACDVSTDIVADWLDDLELSATSINHFRAALIQLYNHALQRDIVEKNPVASIPKRKSQGVEVGILTVEQARKLLKNASPEILPGIALGLFAGIRRAELNRLDWSEIDLEQGYVEIKARKSKTAARRLIPIRDNLKVWLTPLAQEFGSVMPTEMIWRNRLSDATGKALIKVWPHNALRHSFASYHLAHFKDAGALALEMGHGSTKMIFEHYRALVTPAKGKSYWEIMPVAEGKVSPMKAAQI